MKALMSGEGPAWESCGSPIPADFQDHTELNADQPDATSQFSLYSAGGGTRDILEFLPTWIILSHKKNAFRGKVVGGLPFPESLWKN